MRTHVFNIGQVVQILPQLMPRGVRVAHKGIDEDRFEVVRLMPESGSTFQYRIKNTATGQERLVTETEILFAEQ